MVWKLYVYGELHSGCSHIEMTVNLGDKRTIVMNSLIFVFFRLPKISLDVLENRIHDWRII